MARSAGGNICLWHAFLEDLLSFVDVSFWSTPQRLRIELIEIGRQRIDHRWAQDVPDVEHDVARPATLNKGLQLILQILGRLTRQPRDRVIAVKTLCRDAVADFAIAKLGVGLRF